MWAAEAVQAVLAGAIEEVAGVVESGGAGMTGVARGKHDRGNPSSFSPIMGGGSGSGSNGHCPGGCLPLLSC